MQAAERGRVILAAVRGAGGVGSALLQAREVVVSISHTLELAMSRVWERALRLLTSFAAGPSPQARAICARTA